MQQVVEGGVYISACAGGILLCTGWLSPLSEFMKECFPRFSEIEAPISVNIIWMHLYFDGFSDETIHLASFCREEFGFL